jgi:hypothetical protein
MGKLALVEEAFDLMLSDAKLRERVVMEGRCSGLASYARGFSLSFTEMAGACR